MLRGLVTSLRTLTILPVPGRDADQFSSSLCWFPAVGLLLGILQAAAGLAGFLTGRPEFGAVAVIAAGLILTRALHADGLADLADGFFGGRTREDTLRIMKDPATGSFGSLALILLVVAKVVAIDDLIREDGYGMIVAGSVLARMAQVLLASDLPYARPEGGTAGAFVDGAGTRHFICALIVSCPLVLLVVPGGFSAAMILLTVALAVTAAIGHLARRKIGGVTGDVLGACSELTETAVWIAGAMLL